MGDWRHRQSNFHQPFWRSRLVIGSVQIWSEQMGKSKNDKRNQNYSSRIIWDEEKIKWLEPRIVQIKFSLTIKNR